MSGQFDHCESGSLTLVITITIRRPHFTRTRTHQLNLCFIAFLSQGDSSALSGADSLPCGDVIKDAGEQASPQPITASSKI
ncbi:MAG: hypothetical protein U5M23_14725 [Marinagarivorans sp.]|nr:hypothetical protein [Marinagarivorans sp.]